MTMTIFNTTSSYTPKFKSFDKRKTISHSEAKSIYNQFAQSGHIGGNDASSNYGGPAIQALMKIAKFGSQSPDSNAVQNIWIMDVVREN